MWVGRIVGGAGGGGLGGQTLRLKRRHWKEAGKKADKQPPFIPMQVLYGVYVQFGLPWVDGSPCFASQTAIICVIWHI
ncbi:hypothetical protein JZ751_014130 [Albula glossodonta]|uniref:Uncharacterized protein n=1 Tax=Albula glossodonta TaxID=121402 RepID=A0A8T2P3E3_9TELE|nr:hypothetical protein JZ751_014130 [Albula glossodonta]